MHLKKCKWRSSVKSFFSIHLPYYVLHTCICKCWFRQVLVLAFYSFCARIHEHVNMLRAVIYKQRVIWLSFLLLVFYLYRRLAVRSQAALMEKSNCVKSDKIHFLFSQFLHGSQQLPLFQILPNSEGFLLLS